MPATLLLHKLFFLISSPFGHTRPLQGTFWAPPLYHLYIPWQYLTSLLHFKGGLLKSGSSWGSTHLNVPYTLVSRCPKKHLHLFSAVALKKDSNLCMLLNTFQKFFFLISPPISRAPSLVRSRRQQCCVGSPIYFATWQLIGFNWDWFSIICPSYISRSVKLGNVSSYN